MKLDPKKVFTPKNIFTVLSAAGVVATVAVTGIDTKKEMQKRADSEDGNLTKKDLLINYIPTIATLAATETCIVLSHRASAKQMATLTAGLMAMSNRFAEYRNTVKEIDPETDQKAIESFSKSPVDPQISTAAANTFRTPDIIKQSKFAEIGDDTDYILFYDDLTDTWFKATWLTLLGAEYDLNRNMNIGWYHSTVGNFYEFLGIECPEKYKDLTWDVEEFYNDGYVWIDFSHIKCHTDDGQVYYTIFYDFTPQEDNE